MTFKIRQIEDVGYLNNSGNLATEDGHIDPQERALLSELQDMIEDKSVRLVAK